MTNPWRILGIALIAGSTTLILACVGWLADGAYISDFPTWLEAMATGIGLIAAAIAAVYAAGAFQREGARDDRRAAAEERAQAEQVSGWTQAGGKVYARNGSSAPVYDVEFGMHFPAAPMFPQTWKIERIPPSNDELRVNVPGPVMITWDNHGLVITELSISFTDASGRRWDRTSKGALIDRGKVEVEEFDPVERYGLPDDA